jgi:serine/threonine-protein kinase
VIRLERGDGYQPWETQVALASGQVIELPTARLVAGSGVRSKASAAPALAKASSGGSSRASRPSASRERRERAPQTQRAAAPAPAQPQFAAAAPAPSGGAGGTLRINSRPWAQVFVDGRMIGNTPQMNIPLSTGSHNVKLVNPQLGMNKQLKVRIEKGKTTTKIVELME